MPSASPIPWPTSIELAAMLKKITGGRKT